MGPSGASKKCPTCENTIPLFLPMCQACEIKRAQREAAEKLQQSMQAKADIEAEIHYLERLLEFESWCDEHGRR